MKYIKSPICTFPRYYYIIYFVFNILSNEEKKKQYLGKVIEVRTYTTVRTHTRDTLRISWKF